MQKIIIWFYIERSRANAFFAAFLNATKLFLQKPFIKMLWEAVWHTSVLLLIGFVAIVVFGILFPPLLMFLYLFMYPTIFITFIVLFVIVIWLRPHITKVFETVSALILAFINRKSG